MVIFAILLHNDSGDGSVDFPFAGFDSILPRIEPFRECSFSIDFLQLLGATGKVVHIRVLDFDLDREHRAGDIGQNARFETLSLPKEFLPPLESLDNAITLSELRVPC